MEQGSDLLINVSGNNGQFSRAKKLFNWERRDICIVAGLEEVNFTHREGACKRKKYVLKPVACRGIH